MERTMIQLLKLTASKLHNRKLKGLTGEELSGLLGEVQARFHLDNVDEAVVFTALFDCGCGGRKNDLNDLVCLLYTSPSPRDLSTSRMPSSA